MNRIFNHIQQAAYKNGYLIITAAWLYTISFIFSNYFSYNSSPEKVTENIANRIHKLESRFESLANDTALVAGLIFDTVNADIPLELQKEEAGFFVYELKSSQPSRQVYWNTNKITVPEKELVGLTPVKFVNTSNGQFILLKKKLTLRGQGFLLVNMIPVKWAYFIQNKYFVSDFADFPGLDEQYVIADLVTDNPVYNKDGVYLFSLQLIEGKRFIAYDIITICLRLLAVFLLFTFIHGITLELIRSVNFKAGIVFLLINVFFLRLVAYLFPFPFDYSKLPLFDPTIYASNWVNSSLGALLINAILFYWVLRFIKIHFINATADSATISPFSVVMRLFILTTSAFLIVSVIQSLVRDAKISFDVTNFFSLTIYSTIGIVILCFLALGYFYLSQLLVNRVMLAGFGKFIPVLVIILSGFVNILLVNDHSQVVFYLLLIVWVIIYYFILGFRRSDIRIQIIKSPFFIFWVMFFALSISSLVIYQKQIVEFEQRKRIAEKLAIQSDPSGESLLKIAASNFNNSFLSDNFQRFHESEYTNKFIKDSLINQNFSGYLNKYDTRIYTFDSLFHPLFNEDSLNYSSIKTIVLNQAMATDIPNLFTYDNNANGFNYIYQVDVERNAATIGHLFVLMKSKRYKSEALYPELFNQSQDVIATINSDYAYAIYSKGKLINHFNNYNFPTVLSEADNPAFEFTYRKTNNHIELWYNAGNDRQVAVVKQNAWFIELITLFAYLFCSFLLIIFVFHIGSLLVDAKFNLKQMFSLLRLNIRSQIQATIIFVSVFSFLVIGIATISFFIYRYNTTNEERLTKSIQVMANEMNAKVISILATDDEPNNSGIKNELENVIAEISDLHNVDINYYSAAGDLIISTQPYIYNKNLLSRKMDPIAFYEMQRNNRIRFIQSESIGGFGYTSIYTPLMYDNGDTYGYLNIPYLNSQLELNQEISGFLATLINLNAFIFLLAGAIAFFITNRITSSLRLIGATMQKMSLEAKNQPIEWYRNDEIGALVNEYNSMVKKLEISAASLAQTEREGAWREMARQVAHEIKNPLTPMKLSIQYLQNAVERGAPNVQELSLKLAKTLIEQIDQLAKIAGDFSQFANIGNVKLEKFSIVPILESFQHLYEGDTSVTIELKNEAKAVTIESDKVQINRLFMNLIQNAIEAGKEMDGKALLQIRLKNEENWLIIELQDFSGGIPASMKPNMFRPNFTTKSAGTGLGLAICKGIVEQANGQIAYQSTDGVGALFTIRFPVAGG